MSTGPLDNTSDGHIKPPPSTLDYEAGSDAEERYRRLQRTDRTTVISGLILTAIILSGLFSCALAGAFWLLIIRSFGQTH